MIRWLLFFTMLASPALADECTSKVAGLFEGGALDPFSRPAHRFVTTTHAPDGAVKSTYHAAFETSVRNMGWFEGHGMQTLILGARSWIRTAEDAPWTEAPNMVPQDHEAFQREQHAQMLANLARVACPGMVDVGGASFDKVVFFTKTDPTEASHNAWFGGMNSVFIDPATDRVMRWEKTEMVSSFAEGIGEDRQVMIFTYDPSIKFEEPE